MSLWSARVAVRRVVVMRRRYNTQRETDAGTAVGASNLTVVLSNGASRQVDRRGQITHHNMELKPVFGIRGQASCHAGGFNEQ